MFELKPLSPQAIPEALEKAERYRLLNEPLEAESICLDILRIDPENQQAIVWLLLSLTDQIGPGTPRVVEQAKELLPRLQSEYEKAYYTGLIAERRAKARLRQGGPGAGSVVYELLAEAMAWYERAEARRPEGNDDAILRWNTCARIIMNHQEVRPESGERVESFLE